MSLSAIVCIPSIGIVVRSAGLRFWVQIPALPYKGIPWWTAHALLSFHSNDITRYKRLQTIKM